MPYYEDDPTALLEREPVLQKPPPLYQVFLLNDDYTPMEFVVHVLQNFFRKTQDEAVAIMIKVHKEGRGICGVYPKDIAMTKVDSVLTFAKEHQHPLQCLMEEMEE